MTTKKNKDKTSKKSTKKVIKDQSGKTVKEIIYKDDDLLENLIQELDDQEKEQVPQSGIYTCTGPTGMTGYTGSVGATGPTGPYGSNVENEQEPCKEFHESSIEDALKNIAKYASILEELDPAAQIEKDKKLEIAAEDQTKFINYVNDNAEFIKYIISYYKRTVMTRDNLIDIIKNKDMDLEKQVNLFMNTIQDYENTIEDLITTCLPKPIGPTLENVFGKEYHSGDSSKKERERWLAGSGSFKRNK